MANLWCLCLLLLVWCSHLDNCSGHLKPSSCQVEGAAIWTAPCLHSCLLTMKRCAAEGEGLWDRAPTRSKARSQATEVLVSAEVTAQKW
ncbi:hypothetical protein I79_004375 [Cricetulus griseus]|uniref:Uncharacterized protein n=1 Tax=Cricetulus griseus TaxID=10029 RepID=G3H2G3_CRIGR|nr:hypothetical protein I79_004375 [Cricetulus griseus]